MNNTMTILAISLLSFVLLIVIVLVGANEKQKDLIDSSSNPNHPLNKKPQSQNYRSDYTDPIGRPLALPYSILRHPQLLYQPRPMPSIFGKCL